MLLLSSSLDCCCITGTVNMYPSSHAGVWNFCLKKTTTITFASDCFCYTVTNVTAISVIVELSVPASPAALGADCCYRRCDA